MLKREPYSGPLEYLVEGFPRQQAPGRRELAFPYQMGVIRTQIDTLIDAGIGSELLLREPQIGSRADRGSYQPMLIQTPEWILGRLNTDNKNDQADYNQADAIFAAHPGVERWVLTENYGRPSPLPDGNATEVPLDGKAQKWLNAQLNGGEAGAVYVAQGTDGFRELGKVFDSQGESTRENPWIAFQVRVSPDDAVFNPTAGMSLVDWLHNGKEVNGAVVSGRVDGVSGPRGHRECKLVELAIATSTGKMPVGGSGIGLYVVQTTWGPRVSWNRS